MPGPVFGEICADGARVALIGGGDARENDEAAKALRRMTMAFAKSRPPGGLTAPLTWPLVVQLALTFDGHGSHGSWHPGPKLAAWTREEAARRSGTPSVVVPFALPPGLQPRPYQVQGASQIAAAGKFLLLDEPGTGKTVTTILGLRWREHNSQWALDSQPRGDTDSHAITDSREAPALFPLVIIVPAWEVADGWAREMARWAPDWPAPVMYAGPDRMRILAENPDIILTTYATARIDAPSAEGPLAKLKAAAVVADEFHYLKNPDAKRSLAARRIAEHASVFVGLSGTSVTRDTGDIFPALAAMDPGAWTSRERFVKRFCERAEVDYGEVIEGLKQLAEPEFRMCMLGAMRRVAKADVLPQLPPKVYSVRRVQLPREWRRAYDTMLAQMLAELPDGGELPVMDTLAQLTRLLQLASAAADVEEVKEADPVTGEEKVRYEVTLKRPSWKAEALVRVMQERPGQQVVCFSPSAQLVKIAGAVAEDEGYTVGYVTGTDTRTHRRDYLEAFAAGRLDLMCATTGAGGTGINELAVAGTAVFLGRGWPLEESIQSEDRLHRIGQEHDCVEIIDVVAADTADERVRDKLRSKAGQFADFVKDPRIVKELLGGLQ